MILVNKFSLVNIQVRKIIITFQQITLAKQNLMNTNSGKQLMEDVIRKTINKQGAWAKHVSRSCCKCQNCTCGKHKCQIKAPHLYAGTHNSTYKKQYQKKKLLSISSTKNNKSYQSYHPKQLISKSLYKVQFRDKTKESQVPEKQIYHDNIEIGGPTFSQTTYQNNYASHGSPSPSEKIKNPENLGISPGSKMNGISNYRQTFKWYPKQKIRKQKPIYQQNNLRVELNPFIAQTSYSAHFHNFPNYKRDKSNFAPDRSFHSNKGIRTQTSYHDHYRQKKIQKCPADTCC